MITIVLIEPENPGNVGAICRAMKNFDFENLVLVNPKFKSFKAKSSELRNRAKWANDLVDNIKTINKYDKNSLKRLHKKYDYLVATTARLGRDYNVLRSPMTPEQLASRIVELKSPNIAIIIGREGSGLSNDEIKQCDFTVTIPTSKKYGTMNVSHATTVMLYEIFKKQATENIISHITPITQKEKEQLIKLLEQSMKHMHFLDEKKRDTQRMVWKKMIGKSFLSRREAYALMGFLRKIQ
jgi:tRNA/rRNA methyltransferase